MSDDLDIKRFKAASLPVRDYTYLHEAGVGVSSTDRAYSEHISIPCRDTR